MGLGTFCGCISFVTVLESANGRDIWLLIGITEKLVLSNTWRKTNHEKERGKNMIERFNGENGRRLLIQSIKEQQIVQGDEYIATALADAAELFEFEPCQEGARFIRQNGGDTDIYLILIGEVSIHVDGHEVARRKKGQHVGEMSSIDPTAPRSACVTAILKTVVAKYSEERFSALASKHPLIWRRISVEMAARLRERANLLPKKNTKPRIFIGSSSESVSILRAVQECFDHDDYLIRPWTDGVFRASSTAIEDLLREVTSSDFAILVLTDDDMSIQREIEQKAPRDNCIFELGLFMGSLGRERTFIIKPRGADIKMPSDLLGITPLEFQPKGVTVVVSDLSNACNKIRDLISGLGCK